jgi:multiple sugar transport system substrate-binding protein
VKRGFRSGLLLLAAVLLAVLSCAPARRKPQPEKIVLWEFWPAEVIQPLVAEFERENPGLEVRVEPLDWQSGPGRISAAVAADSVPDLCQIGSDWMPGLLAGGKLADWSAGVADLRDSLRGWEICSVGDALYGVPWFLETRALFYNRILFARARLDPERPPETWDDLYRDAAAIQRLGHGVHGFGVQGADSSLLARTVLPFLWGNGGSILSDDLRRATFDSAQNVEALEFYLRLRRVGILRRGDSLDREFIAGRLGLELSGAGLFEWIPREAPGLRYGVALVPMPASDRGAHASWAGGQVLVSFEAAKHKHEALELARFLVRPRSVLVLAAVARARGDVPATAGVDTSAYYHDRPGERMLLRQLESAQFAPNHRAWVGMEAAIEDEVAQALAGRKTAAEAVHDAQARLSELVRQR